MALICDDLPSCETCEDAGVITRCIGPRDWTEPCPDCGLADDPPDHIDWSGITWSWK